jgi:hypothetical protein
MIDKSSHTKQKPRGEKIPDIFIRKERTKYSNAGVKQELHGKCPIRCVNKTSVAKEPVDNVGKHGHIYKIITQMQVNHVWHHDCQKVCRSAEYPKKRKKSDKTASRELFQCFAMERLHNNKTTDNKKQLDSEISVSVPAQIVR